MLSRLTVVLLLVATAGPAFARDSTWLLCKGVGTHGRILPRIRGTAYVNAESTLLLDPEDPFAMGIRA